MEIIHAKLYAFFTSRYQDMQKNASQNYQKYGIYLIWFSCFLSIAVILSPMSSDFAMNLGVAGLLFLSENIIEKHFNVPSTWKFAYTSSQFMLIISMVLGLPFGIDKHYTFLLAIGCLLLILAILFSTMFLTYSFKRRIAENLEKPKHHETKGCSN